MFHLFNKKVSVSTVAKAGQAYGNTETITVRIASLPCRMTLPKGRENMVNGKIARVADLIMYCSTTNVLYSTDRITFRSQNYEIIALDIVEEGSSKFYMVSLGVVI